jgi:hypothetical protein
MPPVEMRSWGRTEDRLAGKNDFVQGLRTNPGELEPCQTIDGYARGKFAEWGHFYLIERPPVGGFPIGKVPIPADVVFEVYASRTQQSKRDKRVVLIVDMGAGAEPYDAADVQVWRCTYTPYVGAEPAAHPV